MSGGKERRRQSAIGTFIRATACNVKEWRIISKNALSGRRMCGFDVGEAIRTKGGSRVG